MNGFLLINKPAGMTSFGVTARVRKKTGVKRVGHAGTLDPMATGVLPVFIGQAARFCDLLPDHTKGYCARFLLGYTTDTLDSTGAVVQRFPVHAGKAELEALLPRFTGVITQVPPMYSALKQNGRRLYDLARQGVEVERPPRRVTIHRLALIRGDDLSHTYEIDVRCTKGTYIRTLIDDIGRALGCGAVMTALTRTFACGFSLADCVTLEQAETAFEKAVLPADRAVEGYPAVTVTEKQAVRFLNGGALDRARLPGLSVPAGLCRVYGPEHFLGLGELREHELAVKCALNQE